MKIKLLSNISACNIKIRILLLLMLIMGGNAFGQLTLPAASPYTQNFDNIEASLPIGWTVRTGASASTIGVVQPLVSGKAVWNNTSGAFKNFASADGLASNSDATAQSNSTDRALGVKQSGNFGDPGAAFVLQLANTTGKTSFKLSFKLQSLDTSAPRTVTWRVDFGLGTSPSTFTSVVTTPSQIVTSTTWGTTNVSVDLPAAMGNQTGNVWIRIVTIAGSANTGTRPSSAIDDVNLAWSAACSAPTVSSSTSAGNNTATGVNLSGNITGIGGANVSEAGFNYGTSANLTEFATSASTGLAVSAVPYNISRTLTGLTGNTVYYYRAYATNNCTTAQTSYSHTSDYPSFTTLSHAPTDIAADQILMHSFRARWSAPTNQGPVSYTYHLQIDDNSDFSSPIYNNEDEIGLNHTQNGLTPTKTYYYRIRVKNLGGYSDWSFTRPVTTLSSNKPEVTSTTFTGLVVNRNFSREIKASNLPDSYAIVTGSTLPAGLSLDTVSGMITGIPTAAGSFTTDVTATKDGETSDPTTLTFEISKGQQIISGLDATIAKVYGDTDYELSANTTSGLPVTYSSSDTSVASVTGNIVKLVGAGTTTITAQQAGDDNWNAAQSVAQILTVAPKELTITGLSAGDKIYDQTSSVVVTGSPMYSGLVNGDSFVVTGNVNWAFENKNAQEDKVLVRTGTYNSPSDDYTVVQPSLQASIFKRNITVSTISAVNKTYNGTANASFTNVSSADILSGDLVSYTIGGSFSDANAGENKAVTVLSITLSGTDGANYNIPSFPTGLFATIFKADQSIIITTIPSVNVGDVLDLNSYATTSSNLPLAYTSSLPAIASISGSQLTANNMGSTTITVSQPGDLNYNSATSAQQVVDVVELPVPLAQWDFYGLNTPATATTVTAQVKNPAITSGSAILTRGLGALYSSGNNSFRTQGFQNNGIALSNTDYFQTSFTAAQNLLSITSIQASFTGTDTFIANPGVQVQFAYSFNDADYIFVNNAATVLNTNQTVNINTAGIESLQDIEVGQTVYFRFYASGQTSTGGYGFYSSAVGKYGLEFIGRVKVPTITWDGAAWSNVNGPNGSQNAIIAGPYAQAIGTDALEVNDLIITENGDLTIEANQGITVNGNITTPDDKIIIESDGSLLQTKLTNANSDNKVIARRSVRMRTSDYTYWSSPLSGQVLRNTINGNASNSSGGFSPGSPNNRTYEYNEVNDTFRATPDAVFLSAKGYAIRGKFNYGPDLTPDQLTFRGNLHNGDYNIQIQKSKNTLVNEESTEHGYNLIGNPYPSNISFYRFFNLDHGNGTKNSDLITGTAWFWTNVPGAPISQGGSAYSANNYAIVNLSGGVAATGSDDVESSEPNEFIRVAQGFIVQMKTPAPTGNTPDYRMLKFDNSVRTNNNTGYFYNGKTSDSVNRYRLRLISPYNIVNTILLAHIDGATDDYDPDYDAELFSIGDDSFFSKLAAKRLQIQARNNPLVDTDIIPLGAKYSTNGTYRINLGKKEGIFAGDQKIYLKDNLTGTYTDLSINDYSFTATKGFDEGRFEIVYKTEEVLGAGDADRSKFTVSRDGSYHVVISSEVLGRVYIYDGLGRLIYSRKTADKSLRIDTSNFINGIYIIKAENGRNIKTRKIIK